MSGGRSLLVVAALGILTGVRPVHATVYTVAGAGGDFATIQAALDVAVAGDTIEVEEKPLPYFEKLVFPRSGDTVAGFITLMAAAGHAPVIDGTGVPGDDMVLIDSKSWVRLIGFEIRNNLDVNDGSGVRVLGSGSHIEIRQNRIHDIRDQNAMGITVYGTAAAPLSDLVIDGNEIYDCEPAPSEALTLNGNVTDFAVTNNVVRDVDNIGIDFIGGEIDIQPDPSKVVRNGVCRGNVVMRARSSYGGGFAGGIYVDGGRDIVIENNLVTESDIGLEVGAENAGIVTRGIIVRDNVLVGNDKAGLVFGGFQSSAGRVRDSVFSNNTCLHNDTLGAGFGELWIQYAESNQVRQNVFAAAAHGRLLTSDASNVGNVLDYNLWYADAGAGGVEFLWNGTLHESFAAYRTATGQDASSLFADPLLVDPASGDVHLAPASPAINAGDPAFVPAPGETDLDGAARVNGPRVDIGADEATICGNGVVEPGEACDDGDLTSGDGCDANCTPTACGNGIVTAGEQCDDGNLTGGDCCAPSCQFEASGSPCSDGDACTTTDVCAAGSCAGSTVPAGGCRAALDGALLLRAGSTPAKDLISWKWSHGAATALADFGNPVGGATSYTLCLYDRASAVSAVRLGAALPGGGTCRGRPCWKTTGSTGLRYANRDALPAGIFNATLKAGPDGGASVRVKAKGVHLSLPTLPFAQDAAVTVQLVGTNGACWESVFDAPATRNDGEQFKDQLD